MSAPEDDLDRLMTVMDAAFDPTYGEAWNRKQVEDSLLFGRNHYFLVNELGGPAVTGEQAAGFFLARTGYQEEELLLLAVLPQFRSRGLGRILLDELSRTARTRGAERIFLEMRRANPAEMLYRNYGFTTIGERPGYYRSINGERIDAITFALELSERTASS